MFKKILKTALGLSLLVTASQAMAEFVPLEKELVTNPYFLNGDMTGWTLVSGASGIRPYLSLIHI